MTSVTVKKAGHDSLTLEWPKADGASEYHVYQYLDGELKEIADYTAEDNGDGTYYGAGETLYSDPCESDQYGPMQGYVTDYASYVS